MGLFTNVVVNDVRIFYDYVSHFDNPDVDSKVKGVCGNFSSRYFGKDGTLYVYSCGSIKVYVLVRGDGEATMYIEAHRLKPGYKKEFDEKDIDMKMSLLFAFSFIFSCIILCSLPSLDDFWAVSFSALIGSITGIVYGVIAAYQSLKAEDAAKLEALLKL